MGQIENRKNQMNSMNTECGLKKVYVCITNQYEQINVDKVIADLRENLEGTGIEVDTREIQDDEHGVIIGQDDGQNAIQDDGQDCIILGDTDYADIGLGEKYRGTAKYVTYHAEDIDVHDLNLVWARKYGKPLVIAETDRLLIREMTLDDLDDLYGLYDSLKECPYVEPLYDRQEEEKFSGKYIENMYTFFGYGLWLVYLKNNLQLVARVGIENRVIDGETKQELGYLVHRDFWHQHIAMESCQIALDYAKNILGIEHIYTCIHKENKPSIALAKKLGFDEYAMNVDGMNIYSSNT